MKWTNEPSYDENGFANSRTILVELVSEPLHLGSLALRSQRTLL